MIIAVPVTSDAQVDPRWGRAARVAVARVQDGQIAAWDEHEVRWDELHDSGTEGGHHARIARFVIDQGITMVVANHMGPPMVRMLGSMGIDVRLGAMGSARLAVTAAA
jgi:predicted Fe-Mo cluster-binding NifX family protein